MVGARRPVRRLRQEARWEVTDQGRWVAGFETDVKVDATIFARDLGGEGKRTFTPLFP